MHPQNIKRCEESLGNKRNQLSDENIEHNIKTYNKYEINDETKIFDNEDFGYTKVAVERPLQLNYQVTDERLENLYSIRAFDNFAKSKSKDPNTKLKEEKEGKQKQEVIISKLKKIDGHYNNWDKFEIEITKSLKSFNISKVLIKNIIIALSEHDDTADYVTDSKGNKKPDGNIRTIEKIPLKKNIEEYFKKEVLFLLPRCMDGSTER